MIVNFKTRKLKHSIDKITLKYKDLSDGNFEPVVYGVTKDEGISITGKEVSADLSNYYVFDEHTFAYNPYRVNIGSIGLSEKGQQGLVSPAYVVFKTKKDILPEFLFQFLKSDIGIAQINWYGNRGGVRNALRYDALGEIDFPDLSREEQLVALKKLNATNQSIQPLLKEIDSQLNYIQLLRQTILQEAVQGKLVPQDPSDEPASELIKKIHAEKEQLIKDKKIKKSKPLPPITDDEIPYELPEGWVWCRVNSITHKVTDGEHTTPRRSQEGYFLLSARNVTDKGIDLSNVDYVPKDEFNRIRKRCNPDKGDILISCSGSVGRTAIVDEDNKYVMVRSAALIKSNWGMVNNTYLLYSIKSPVLQAQILKKSKTSAQSNLFIGKILELLIPLPPTQEQKRIVTKVEQLIQLCDDLEAQVQQSKTDAEQLLQAVLREAFEGGEKKSTKPREASWEFKESVLISALTNKFGTTDFPLGRKRYTKLSYLFHRHLTDDTTNKYIRKAADPYNPETKYKGPEQIAVTNKYVKPHKKDKYSGFIIGEGISSAMDYYSRYWDNSHIDWLEQFRYKTNDELELYATVDNALIELYKNEITPSVSQVKSIIKNESEWKDKLKRPIFSDDKIKSAIEHLLKLFSYN